MGENFVTVLYQITLYRNKNFYPYGLFHLLFFGKSFIVFSIVQLYGRTKPIWKKFPDTQNGTIQHDIDVYNRPFRLLLTVHITNFDNYLSSEIELTHVTLPNLIDMGFFDKEKVYSIPFHFYFCSRML